MIKIHRKYSPLWKTKCRYYIVTGGRGSSKSFSVGLFIENLTWQKGHVILFTRYTLVSAGISVIPEFIEKIDLHSSVDNFDIKKDEIINKKTATKIIFRGIKTSTGTQTANLKSIQGLTTWVLDEAEELPEEETFDKIDESVRQKDVDNRVIIVLNPTYRKHWIFKRFFLDRGIAYNFNGIVDDTCYIHTSFEDNRDNLSESFLKKAYDLKKQNENKFNHRFLGQWIDEVNGALWTEKIIQKVYQCPDLKKVIISIDPSGTGTSESDECGIICIGKGFDGFYYVFRDETGIYTPLKWANKVVYLHSELEANCIVAEVNQGWDMVKTIIHQIDRAVKVEEIVARKGKYLRAEPIVSLYEQGLVKHVNGLGKLEHEMTTWTPDDKYSPGRIDALVHGLTYLHKEIKPIEGWG